VLVLRKSSVWKRFESAILSRVGKSAPFFKSVAYCAQLELAFLAVGVPQAVVSVQI